MSEAGSIAQKARWARVKAIQAANDPYVREMAKRANELRIAEGLAPVPERPIKPAPLWLRPDADQEIFEAVCDALAGSDMDPENGFVIEAAPGFAALLTRIAEQTAAEFGARAAANAFRWMADIMVGPEAR